MATSPAKTNAPAVLPQHQLDELFRLARVSASRLWPYTSVALFRLVPRWTDGYEGLLTLAVDFYWRLYMCRAFVSRLTPNMLALLIVAHELQHLLLYHGVRLAGYRGVVLTDQKGKTVELINLANDLAINSRIPDFIEAARQLANELNKVHMFPADLSPPADGAYPNKFRDAAGVVFPDNLLSEDYAALLLTAAEANGSVPGACGVCRCGTGAGGSAGSAPWEDKTPPVAGDSETGVHPDEVETVRVAVAKATAEAAAKSQGSVPGHLVTWAKGKLAPPRVRWEEELRRVLRVGIDEIAGRVDRTYRRPNRRAAGSRVLLPGTISYLPRVLVVFDTSGSMTPADYDAVFSEIQGLILARTAGGRGVPCIACDAAAAAVQWVTDVRHVKMVGGGGTDMMVGIHAAKRARAVNPGLVVVLTDGYTSWDAENPYPELTVLGVLTNRNATPPPAWVRTVYACD